MGSGARAGALTTYGMGEATWDNAYRGYRIRKHPLTGETWIEKSGAHIGYAESYADAVVKIDALLGEE